MITCPGCGGEFPPKLISLLAGTGALLCCSRCNTAFSPSEDESFDKPEHESEGGLGMRTSPARKEIRDVVYKYRPPDDRSIQILLDRKLFCGPPRGLNDPLDCQFNMKAEVNRARFESRRDWETIRRGFGGCAQFELPDCDRLRQTTRGLGNP